MTNTTAQRRALTKRLNCNRIYTNTHYNRGLAYMRKGEVDNALADYSGAIQFKHNYAEAYNNRGITYQKKGEIIYAVQDYSTAIGLNPELAEPHANRGQSLVSADWIFTVPFMTAPRHSGWIRTRAWLMQLVAWRGYITVTGKKRKPILPWLLSWEWMSVHCFVTSMRIPKTLSGKQRFGYQRMSRKCWLPKRNFLNLRRTHDLSSLLKAYDNEELSTGLAARFAGMSREKFIYTMGKYGLSPY